MPRTAGRYRRPDCRLLRVPSIDLAVRDEGLRSARSKRSFWTAPPAARTKACKLGRLCRIVKRPSN